MVNHFQHVFRIYQHRRVPNPHGWVTHTIHGHCIFTYIYHKNSTINVEYAMTGCWFQIYSSCSPPYFLRKIPIWLIFSFKRGWLQPPTRWPCPDGSWGPQTARLWREHFDLSLLRVHGFGILRSLAARRSGSEDVVKSSTVFLGGFFLVVNI